MSRNRRNNLNNVNCDEINYIRNNVTSNNYRTYISRFHLKNNFLIYLKLILNILKTFKNNFNYYL